MATAAPGLRKGVAVHDDQLALGVFCVDCGKVVAELHDRSVS